MIDFSAAYLTGLYILCFSIFTGFLLVMLLVYIIIRMKIRKEVGMLKAHLKYHPDPPVRVYQLDDTMPGVSTETPPKPKSEPGP